MPKQWKVFVMFSVLLSVLALGSSVGLFLWNLDKRRDRVEMLNRSDQQVCEALRRVQGKLGVKRFSCSKLPKLPH